LKEEHLVILTMQREKEKEVLGKLIRAKLRRINRRTGNGHAFENEW